MPRSLMIGLSLLVVVSACSYTEPAVKLTPPPSSAAPVPSILPSTRPSESMVFSVDGVGPYVLGADFHQLDADGRLSGVIIGSQTCGDHLGARGVPPYQDILVSARPADGKVYLVVNRPLTFGTASGAKLGSTMNELKTIFGAAGEELNRKPYTGYLVKSPSGNGMLFDFDVNSKKVTAVIAGNAAYLRESFLYEDDYC
jgi:hypothetical protein